MKILRTTLAAALRLPNLAGAYETKISTVFHSLDATSAYESQRLIAIAEHFFTPIELANSPWGAAEFLSRSQSTLNTQW